MREIEVQTFVTLDGVMQAPGGPDEDRSGGFANGGWSQPYWDETMGAAMGKAMEREYDLLLGRKTYDVFAAHWPNAPEDDPVRRKFDAATKYVVTSSPDTLAWQNSEAITGDVAARIADLKAGDGSLLSVQGSGQLTQTLLESDLVDSFRIWTFPVVLGAGKRLFGDGAAPLGLRLTETETSSTGVTMARYQAAGDVRTGSFALETR